jgi:hypothetical protein
MTNGERMDNRKPTGREGERGSALVLATLITVIMSLLGISYLMMAQTENTIAENERNAAMALYVAEAGTRLTVAWLNDPTATGFLVPGTAQLDRTKRLLDHDFNSGTVRVKAVSADATKPLYKDPVVTPSTVFERPYRSSLGDTFYGIETGTDPDPSFASDGPDLVVTAAHLATINNTLFPDFPSADLRARIARIEIYSPPVINIGGIDTRMGIATIKVIGGVFIFPGTGEERQIATRIVKAVVNEIPVPGPVGPLQSCSTMDYNGDFLIHWGAGSSVGDADVPSNLDAKIRTGLPYALNDPFTYINGGNTLATWATAQDGNSIEDPWFKFLSGGTIDEAPNTNVQPWPHTYPGDTVTDHSNMFQNSVVDCPTFDYALWKSIAQSGSRNHYYYTWDSGQNFRLDGTGPSTDFKALIAGKGGVQFFDTRDQLAPRGLYTDTWPTTNLTDAIAISGGGVGTQGFLFLNSKDYRQNSIGGVTRTIFPPGEPGDGSGFVNLDYPGTAGGAYTVVDGAPSFDVFYDPPPADKYYCTDASQCDGVAQTQALAPVQDDPGLPFQDNVAIDGVFYTSGAFTLQGNDTFFGSVVAEQGVLDGGGTPNFFFDESLVKGNWPRPGMDIPRVVVTAWETDL